MPSLGMPELILILVLALVIFGPKKLPEVGKSLGKTLNEFRRASVASFSEINDTVDDVKKTAGEATKEVKEIKDEVHQAANMVKGKSVTSSAGK